MTTNSNSERMAEILQDSRSVERLARRLIRDVPAADDLIQETLLARLRFDGTPLRSPRAWMGRVFRNLLWQRLRRDERRTRRERHGARAEAVPSTVDLAAREESRRLVTAALLELPAHYRAPIVLRYLDGLPPREIAARLDIPVATARTQIRRGLHRLRHALRDRHDGDERNWIAALLPVPGTSKAGHAAGVTSMAATNKLTWALVPVLLLVGMVFLVAYSPNAGTPDADTRGVGTLMSGERAHGTRADAGNPTLVGHGAAAATPVRMATLSGRIATAVPYRWGRVELLLRGSPRSGALRKCKTNASGEFEWRDIRPGTYTLRAGCRTETEFGRVDICLDPLTAGEIRADIVVHIPLEDGVHTVEGRAVDQRGRPVRAGLGVDLICQPTLARHRELTAQTDAQGRFRFVGVNEGAARVLVSAPRGDAQASFTVPLRKQLTVTCYDYANSMETTRLSGTIMDTQGRPVPHARVALVTGVRARPESIMAARSNWGSSRADIQASNGTFSWAGVVEGPLMIVVTDARDHIDGKLLDLARKVLYFDALPGDPIEVHLERGIVVSGTVRKPEGAGVAGVRLVAGDATVVTDASGQFKLRRIAAGTRLACVVPGGFVVPPTRAVAEGDVIDILLEKSLTIQGSIIDTDRRRVRAHWSVKGPGAHWTAGSGEAVVGPGGAFRIEGLPSGARANLTVPARRGHLPEPALVSHNVSAGARDVAIRPVTTERIPATAAPFTLAGTISGLTAASRGPAWIQLWGRVGGRVVTKHHQIDLSGETFDLSIPDEGDWYVCARPRRAPELYALTGPVSPDATDVHLAFRTGRALTGTLYSASTGEAMPGRVIHARGENGWRYAPQHTDRLGRFQFPGLAPGRYELIVEGSGGADDHCVLARGIEPGQRSLTIDVP